MNRKVMQQIFHFKFQFEQYVLVYLGTIEQITNSGLIAKLLLHINIFKHVSLKRDWRGCYSTTFHTLRSFYALCFYFSFTFINTSASPFVLFFPSASVFFKNKMSKINLTVLFKMEVKKHHRIRFARNNSHWDFTEQGIDEKWKVNITRKKKSIKNSKWKI